MRLENEGEVKFSSYEVEMSEAKPPIPLGSGASLKMILTKKNHL